jgi:Fusaric acid resistance protein-like
LARHGPKPQRSPDRLNGVDTLPETRSCPGSQLEHRLRRWRSAALPIAQAALAAPIAAVVCLSLSLGERLRRVIELIVGVAVGVGVGDLLISRIGTGPWQIALVVALAMSVAVLLDCGAVGTVQAAVVDGLIGVATGLLAVGVFGRNACAGPPSL